MKRHSLPCAFLALFSILLLAGISSADTVTLTPTSAFRILAVGPEDHGLGILAVYNDGGTNVQHTILKFDFSSIPSGSTINSATLTLRTAGWSQPEGTHSDVFAISRLWDDTASWLNASPGVPWATPGGDVIGAAYAVNSDVISGGSTSVNWNVSSLITAWRSGSRANYGMMLTGTPGNTLHFSYDSPAITVTYVTNDADHDGISDQFETGTGIYVSPTDTGTSPTNADTDGDGLNDGAEVNVHHTNPNLADTDGDGFTDSFELNSGFNPLSAQSTPDALTTLAPARRFRFSAANGVSYRIEGSTDTQNWTTLEASIPGTGAAITRYYADEDLGPRYFLRARRNE